MAKLEVPKPKPIKTVPKIIDYIFIEYTNNRSAYQILICKSGNSKHMKVQLLVQ